MPQRLVCKSLAKKGLKWLFYHLLNPSHDSRIAGSTHLDFAFTAPPNVGDGKASLRLPAVWELCAFPDGENDCNLSRQSPHPSMRGPEQHTQRECILPCAKPSDIRRRVDQHAQFRSGCVADDALAQCPGMELLVQHRLDQAAIGDSLRGIAGCRTRSLFDSAPACSDFPEQITEPFHRASFHRYAILHRAELRQPCQD